MTDDRSLPLDHEPLNRAERRARRYKPNLGKPDPHAVTVDPAAEAALMSATPPEDEAAGIGGDDDGSFARSGSGDVTKLTGTGTGGATEHDGRMPEHEGMHRGNQPNS
jgi:hypothetical protein